MTLFALNAMAQQPDTTKSPVVKSADTLMSTRKDTDATRSFKPKAKPEKVYHPDSLHSPHTAVSRSLILPGWGQVYNRQWWKVPIIYGTLGLLGYAIAWNNKYYKEFLAISKYREHGIMPGPNDPYYYEYNLYSAQPDQAIYDAQDAYHRDRDLCILGFVGFWGINAIDAYISAKFIHAYTVDTNLSMRVDPVLLNQQFFAQNFNRSVIPGLKITFTF